MKNGEICTLLWFGNMKAKLTDLTGLGKDKKMIMK
jgi:hypothetical protein